MVDKESVSDMARFLNILNGVPQAPQQPLSSTKHTSSDKDAMLKILETIYSVTDETISDGMQVKEIKDAYETQQTPNGIRIGDWCIDCINESKSKKIYNIREENSSDIIFGDLSLYEAAQSIVVQFRNGNDKNSSVVQKILKLENEYSKHLNDAIIYGQILHSKSINETRRMIIEDKYESSKFKARNIREQLKLFI